MMKAGQSTFEERLSRINTGKPMNAVDVVSPQQREKLMHSAKGRRRVHLDMLVAGGIAGGIAGTLFLQNIGLLFLMSLDWITIQGLVLSDYKIAAYMGVCALGPLGFVWSVILSRKSKRAVQFWFAYMVGVLAANHNEVRYVVEFIVIPGFWEYVGTYTSAKDVVNDAVATQPQF
ncbi:hypothetical protein [uncultured Tateyamaria sp.]|uniref:hypothetical protein n=1 Tax=Tateyamaria sp. 1078 TaxID=3417464 RepID=UPI002638A316|nr:hypothetical protein [uncultured Tateyamaria sp.]